MHTEVSMRRPSLFPFLRFALLALPLTPLAAQTVPTGFVIDTLV